MASIEGIPLDGKAPRLIRELRIKSRDFVHAGEGSMALRDALKSLGLDADFIRRVSICAYEAEMNVVMHGGDGTMLMSMDEKGIVIEVTDEGPGIDDINMALTAGYSTAGEDVRQMGFGAGMGLPNIIRNSDFFKIFSEKDKGTYLKICFWVKQ